MYLEKNVSAPMKKKCMLRKKKESNLVVAEAALQRGRLGVRLLELVRAGAVELGRGYGDVIAVAVAVVLLVEDPGGPGEQDDSSVAEELVQKGLCSTETNRIVKV